jgi:hypothetical protein
MKRFYNHNYLLVTYRPAALNIKAFKLLSIMYRTVVLNITPYTVAINLVESIGLKYNTLQSCN